MTEGRKDSVLGKIPKSWEVVKFAKACVNLDNLRKPIKSSERQDLQGIYPYYGAQGIIDNINNYIFEGTYLLIAEDGENVKSRKNDIAILASGKFWVNNHAHVVKNNNKSNIIFLKYYINFMDIKPYVTGLAQPKLNKSSLENLIIPLPPLPEQQKIAEILSTVDDKIEIIDQQIIETQELKKGLMQRLLTKGIGHTEYKDSSLGMIPKSWEVVSVKEITKEHKQGFYTKDGYVDNGIRLARITDLNNPKVDFSEMPMLNISDSDYQNYKIEKGDFLFARSGAIGRYGIVENEEHPAVFASYLIRFRFNTDIVNRFFGYFFESYLCENQLRGITQGNANVNINAENIKSLKFPLAPFEEQDKIATIISSVDDKIEVLHEKKSQYQGLKQGLMQQLLTGKIRVKI